MWLIERGQAAGWNPTCYVRALAEFGPHPLQAVWTTQAIHAMQFSSKAEAEGVIAGFLEHPKSLAVEHGFIPDIPVSYAASRPSPAERDREDAVDLACLTLNAAYRCLVFRERQSNFHPTESLGAIAAYLQACLRGGDSLEAAEARYCHPKMHDAASRVSGASDA